MCARDDDNMQTCFIKNQLNKDMRKELEDRQDNFVMKLKAPKFDDQELLTYMEAAEKSE